MKLVLGRPLGLKLFGDLAEGLLGQGGTGAHVTESNASGQGTGERRVSGFLRISKDNAAVDAGFMLVRELLQHRWHASTSVSCPGRLGPSPRWRVRLGPHHE